MLIKSNRNNKVPNVWVLLTLFFCVFTFSGFAPANNQPPEGDFTEELITPQKAQQQKTVPYKSAFINYYQRAPSSFIANSTFNNYLHNYNNGVAIHLRTLTQQYFHFPITLPDCSASPLKFFDSEKSDESS